ncbi:hypothetical protein J132_05421 [Termitomyces sp. J132]|nr:hypothetical protein J132_05421 [Termitomyces sp. J132]
MLTNIEGLWQRRWKKSPRFPKINRIDDTLPSKGYMRLVQDLDRKQSAILTQFRMGHVPLNQYLFRIKRSETPACPHCRELAVETIKHFLFECPHYQYKCQTHVVSKLRCEAESLQVLLSRPDALKFFFRYVRASRRFKTLAPSAHPTPAPPPTHPPQP